MRSISRVPAVLIVLTLMLTGCGQKGPLYIPEETPEDIAEEKAEKTSHQSLPSTLPSED